MKHQPVILLVPGPSAAGRDFLVDKLINKADIVGKMLGIHRPVRIKVAKKITDRPSRSVDLLKRCVSEQEFTEGLAKGEIFADYVLESNGKRYGYTTDAFDIEDADLVVTDVSVYQIPEVKKRFGSRVRVEAMIASRDYRYANLAARGSENPQEVEDRLNLGDAHVALMMLMNRDRNLRGLIHVELADLIEQFLTAKDAGQDTSEFETKIEAFSKSKNVVKMLGQLSTDTNDYIDFPLMLTDGHRLASADDFVNSLFFSTGVLMAFRTLIHAGEKGVLQLSE